MSGIRQSFVWALEDKDGYGKGKGANQCWIAPPPGSYMSSSHQRSTNRIDTVGTKKWDTVVYGKFTGSWDWSFILDYHYLEPLQLAFEDSTAINTEMKTYSPIPAGTHSITKQTVTTAPAETISSEQTPPADALYVMHDTDAKKYKFWVYKKTSDGGYTRVSLPDFTEAEYGSINWTYASLLEKMGAVFTKKYYNRETSDGAELGYLFTDDAPTTLYSTLASPRQYDVNSAGKLIDCSTGAEATYPKRLSSTKCTFKKSDLGRVPSFCIKRKILNRIAGGANDETMELRGCVCKSIKFSMSAGSSQVQVSMSGFYTREVSAYTDLSGTDYTQRTDMKPVEFSCFLLGTLDSNGEHVANVDSLNVSIDNGVNVIDSTCTPFSPAYYEGKSNYGFSASCYANDGKRFHQLLYRGGKKDRTNTLSTPLCKGLAPLEEAHIFSFGNCRTASTQTAVDVYNGSTYKADFQLLQAVVKNASWARGDSGKLQDQLSSVECREIVLTIHTDKYNSPFNTKTTSTGTCHKVADQTSLTGS